jgi:transposase, IS30 family
MKRYKRLGLEDRCQIHALINRGYSDAEIAGDVGVHRTTLWRERRRNGTVAKYYYHLAQAQ